MYVEYERTKHAELQNCDKINPVTCIVTLAQLHNAIARHSYGVFPTQHTFSYFSLGVLDQP